MIPPAEPVDQDLAAVWLRRASGYLAWGSTLLLSAALIPLLGSGVSFVVCYLFTVGAVAIHAVAWVILYRGLALIDEPGGSTTSAGFWNPRRVQRISVAIFIGASLTLPLQFPAGPFSILLLPYVPFVFGPIALSHAYIFARSKGSQRSSASKPIFGTGACWLVAVSLMGIVSQVVLLALNPPFSGSWFFASSQFGAPLFYVFYVTCLPIPAGLTAIGYWLVHFSLRKPRLSPDPTSPTAQVR